MLLQDPPVSPYDWQFQLLGFRVRVTWGFWLVAALLGWEWSRGLDRVAQVYDLSSPGAPVLLAGWIAAVFVSVLIHEFGHALAMRACGMEPRIVLYHFGGLAISDFGSWRAARQRRVGPWEQVGISAAGPALQLAFGGLVIAGAMVAQVPVELMGWVVSPGEISDTIVPYAVVDALVFPSVFWALLNLLPVLPLDGGQICENLLHALRVPAAYQYAQIVSLVTAAAIGLWFLRGGNMFAGFMFLMMAAGSWQALQGGYPRY
ncbi:MAG: peptidase [Pirellulaceae bacterium]|nr:MAG: peptidase [Pirellulaceae bacterium]